MTELDEAAGDDRIRHKETKNVIYILISLKKNFMKSNLTIISSPGR